MGNPREYHFKLPRVNRPLDTQFPERWYPGVNQFWDRCTSERVFHPINGIRAIVIHATAGASSSGAVSRMQDGAASFHWIVPDENEPQHGNLVWACVPETLAAWHVRNDKSHPDVFGGENRVNHWSLGIELVNVQDGKDRFSEWQVEITAKVVRYCWAKYPNLEHVISHAKLDPKRRSDPGTIFPWDIFKTMVLEGANDEMDLLALNVPPLEANLFASNFVDDEEICC